MRRPLEKLIAGIDLHGNNLVIGVINQEGKRLMHRKLDCDLAEVEKYALCRARHNGNSAAFWIMPSAAGGPAKVQGMSAFLHN